MAVLRDGPASSQFAALSFEGTTAWTDLADADVSPQMAEAVDRAPSGACVAWGIPFEIGDAVCVAEVPATVAVAPTAARWLVFLHTSDVRPLTPNADGFISPMRGAGQLNEHAADYVVLYEDGSEEIIKSDAGWKASKSPILMDLVFHGEVYDARLEQPGWNAPEFDDSNWQPVALRRAPELVQRDPREVVEGAARGRTAQRALVGVPPLAFVEDDVGARRGARARRGRA